MKMLKISEYVAVNPSDISEITVNSREGAIFVKMKSGITHKIFSKTISGTSALFDYWIDKINEALRDQ